MTKGGDSERGVDNEALSRGDAWPYHYRGYGLSVNVDGDVWWQAYNGTDRLDLEAVPSEFVETVLELKPRGGRVRITEGGAAIARLEEEDDSDEYETIYIGTLDLKGQLVPRDKPRHAIPVSPDDLEPGDLWPSVYDGAQYSFNGDRYWWHDGETKLRHQFAEPLPREISTQLDRLRTDGGRFVITPGGDVVTQIPTAKTPSDARSQFRELPRTVKRYLQLRRDRGDVDMVPVYVGHLPETERPIEVEEPTRLTDPLSEQEKSSLEAWVSSMASYEESDLSADEHRFEEGGDES